MTMPDDRIRTSVDPVARSCQPAFQTPTMASPLFFLATTNHPIDAQHPMWHRPLPVSRLGESDPTGTISYGQYFQDMAKTC